MALKEIVVHVDGVEPSEHRIRAGLRLAAQHEAHLVGLFVIDIPLRSGYVAAALPPDVLVAEREAWLRRAADAKRQFEALSGTAEVGVEWRCEKGATVERLCTSARHADLLMLASPDASPMYAGDWQRAATSVLMAVGAPLMFLPEAPIPESVGRFVTIGWDGSREASRAVREALPILIEAEHVSVACVDPGSAVRGRHEGVPGADVAHWLARHNVRATAQQVDSGDASVGAALLDWAKGQRADLLVTGGYGHSRLREEVLGGVTRYVFDHARLPVLMSH